jgi:hypothetical protein
MVRTRHKTKSRIRSASRWLSVRSLVTNLRCIKQTRIITRQRETGQESARFIQLAQRRARSATHQALPVRRHAIADPKTFAFCMFLEKEDKHVKHIFFSPVYLKGLVLRRVTTLSLNPRSITTGSAHTLARHDLNKLVARGGLHALPAYLLPT